MSSIAHICSRLALAGLVMLPLHADQKTLTEYSTNNGPASRMRLYVKDALQRTDINEQHAVITRPEAIITLDLQNKTFTRNAIDTSATQQQAVSVQNTETPMAMQVNKPRKGGVVISKVAIEDTGERKEMFGYKARHLKMRTEIVAGPDTCNPGEMRMETDGWYIDLKQNGGTGKADGGNGGRGYGASDCKDEYKSEVSGTGKTGTPLEYVMRTWQNGQGPQVMSMKVIEFSEEQLDAALFEVPAGFTDGKAAMAASGAAASGAASTAASSAATPRGAGVPVGVSPVANAPADANLRLAAHLTAESVGSMPLTDTSLETARKAGVAFQLTAEQVASEGKKKGGMFGKLAQSMGGKEVELRYVLVSVSDGREVFRSSAVSKAGGSGFATALGVAQAAAPLAGASHGGYVAQSAINTAAAAAQGSSLAHLPVHGMMGRHGYAAYSGMMDPNLQSLAYAGRYSPSLAAAQAVGMVASGAAEKAPDYRLPSVDEGADGTLDNAMRKAARVVKTRLK